jgi:hypothetical protein
MPFVVPQKSSSTFDKRRFIADPLILTEEREDQGSASNG